MKDFECPYCGEEIEICHDDGFGYEEGVKHKIECDYCHKNFVFETIITFDFIPEQADCLNGSYHKWKQSHTYPSKFTRMECEVCGEYRTPTKEEWEKINKI